MSAFKTAEIIFFLVALTLGGCTRRDLPDNLNSLSLGQDSKQASPARIALAQPIDISGFTAGQLQNLRSESLKQSQDVLAAEYHSWEPLFSRLDPAKPWVTISGFQYYGLDKLCGAGDSLESLTLLNPLMLLSPRFLGLSRAVPNFEWNPERVHEESIKQPDFPLYPKPMRLEWNAKEATATLSYDLTAYLAKVNPLLKSSIAPADIFFSLSGYNAIDFNLRYIYLNPGEALNMKLGYVPPGPVELVDLVVSRPLAKGHAACNASMLPAPELRRFSLTALPAELHAALWKTAPASKESPPDMRFILVFQ
ncbi:MAG: hypothetical protein K1X83_10225 [Oligoflexia bacterium]|nr:hypothetical protein [Oligoflexia bacterium]